MWGQVGGEDLDRARGTRDELASFACASGGGAVVSVLFDSLGLGLKIFGPSTELLPHLIPHGDPLQFPASVSHGSKFSRVHLRSLLLGKGGQTGTLEALPSGVARGEVKRREPIYRTRIYRMTFSARPLREG